MNVINKKMNCWIEASLWKKRDGSAVCRSDHLFDNKKSFRQYIDRLFAVFGKCLTANIDVKHEPSSSKGHSLPKGHPSSPSHTHDRFANSFVHKIKKVKQTPFTSFTSFISFHMAQQVVCTDSLLFRPWWIILLLCNIFSRLYCQEQNVVWNRLVWL
jgi:hypothetical protein